MKSINNYLEEFDKTLRKHNLTNYERLYAPLSDVEITSKLNMLGCNDENMRALFAWKNGFDPYSDPSARCMVFYMGTLLLSLDSIIESIEANESTERWSGPFIPIVCDDTGQYFLFNNEAGEDYGKIHLYSASLLFVEEPVSYYDSIPAMIETTIIAYEEGVLIYDRKEDWLDYDVMKYHSIAQKINVNSKYWSQ